MAILGRYEYLRRKAKDTSVHEATPGIDMQLIQSWLRDIVRYITDAPFVSVP